MKKVIIGNCALYHGDCLDILPTLEQVDAVVTDPPYLYIKHEFDRKFDEPCFFNEVNRISLSDSFIVMFGRGTSFYRWNTRLSELGFNFKEELVWNKHYTTAPCNSITRTHETISLYTKLGKIRHTKVPYIEQKQFNIQSLINDINRIKCSLNSETGLNEILKFLHNGDCSYRPENNGGQGITVNADILQKPRHITTIKSITTGMKEKSIIELTNDHYKCVHPTQKPVRLMERLINLVSDNNNLILDPFMGSGSTGVACVNLNRKFIGIEINEKYFDIACERIGAAHKEKSFMGSSI